MSFNNKKMILVYVLFLCIFIYSCERPSDQPDEKPTTDDAAPASTGAASVTADQGMEQTAPSPQPEVKYLEGKVTKKKIEGQIEIDTIVSKYPCKYDHDCTSTKFENAPKSENDCMCQAPCTPFVVNKTEKNRRESTNKKFCGPHNWFGPDCPAPPCSFEEFDGFKCDKDSVLDMQKDAGKNYWRKRSSIVRRSSSPSNGLTM